MISIIVPVFKVEPYLKQCLESIVNQTYRDLEILLIDDCSPDRCGAICDEYAKKDSRIQVFHLPENRGLSAARNVGLDNAHGEYIGFVDSDDWIESDMYEILLREMTVNDIVECVESKNRRTREHYNTTEALKALLNGKIGNVVWNKLYKHDVFEIIRFPEGQNFEDVAVMHKLLGRVKSVTVLKEKPLYQHMNRVDSLTQDHSPKNLIDYAYAYIERYRYFYEEHSDLYRANQNGVLRGCIKGNAWVWRWWCECSGAEKLDYIDKIEELKQFARDHFSIFMPGKYSLKFRIAAFFLRSSNRASFSIMYAANKLYQRRKISKLISHTRIV